MFSKALLYSSLLVATCTSVFAAECSTAPVQCCNAVEDHDNLSHTTMGLFDVVGVAVHDITGAVGVTCNPITGIGVGSTHCSATPVCCENNSFHGVVALGCVPFNLSV